MQKYGSLIAVTATAAALLLTVPLPASAGSPAVAARASGVPKAVNGKRVRVRLWAGIRKVPTARGVGRGYERSKFKLWVDANHDCQDTRSEVLRQESERRVSGNCRVKRGKWVSYYDHARFTNASELDIDHLVPLAEAWRSGARSWGRDKREAYANDLTDPRTLVAVSAHANRSKGDRDPAQWLPTFSRCRYVRSWVAVKLRWRLSADPAEKAALRRVARHCTNSVIRVHRAKVRHAGSGSGSPGHGCTRTSTGSCIEHGEFCPKASYGTAGHDASGNRWVCTGDHSHPRWG